jgi:hypothetical protein
MTRNNSQTNPFHLVALACLCITLAACGGGGGSATGASSVAGGPVVTPVVNYAPIVVDAGPPQVFAINAPYTTVTLCAPGSTTQCQTIDHVLVDTGSTGFRVLASVLGNGLNASQLRSSVDAGGNALVECTQFVDGYSWGPVKRADLKIGGETASNIAIQVIGDPAFPTSLAPSTCANLPNGSEDTVVSFGANGVLGVGNYLQDCGPYCTITGSQDGSNYNACTPGPTVTCQPAAVSVAQQVSNPVASFATDNNGVVLQLPAVAASGAALANGTLYFGIGTQSNNALGSATVYGLDPATGTLLTTFAGTKLSQSFIDSGSNGYFFNDASLPACKVQTSFYCPLNTLALSAQIQGGNGTLAQVAFSVSNADAVPASYNVLPSLAGPATASTATAFDWGLPFFLGRSTFIGLEGTTLAGVTGLSDAF